MNAEEKEQVINKLHIAIENLREAKELSKQTEQGELFLILEKTINHLSRFMLEVDLS